MPVLPMHKSLDLIIGFYRTFLASKYFSKATETSVSALVCADDFEMAVEQINVTKHKK